MLILIRRTTFVFSLSFSSHQQHFSAPFEALTIQINVFYVLVIPTVVSMIRKGNFNINDVEVYWRTCYCSDLFSVDILIYVTRNLFAGVNSLFKYYQTHCLQNAFLF